VEIILIVKVLCPILIKMIKLRWLKKWKNRSPGDVSNAGEKSAGNFVSQGYAEYVEKSIKKTKESNNIIPTTTTVTHVTDVTDVTHVTDVTDIKNTVVTPVTLVTPVTPTHAQGIFTGKTIDLILREFVTKKDCFTFAELAKNLGKKEDIIRQNINRHKELFDVKLLDGKKCHRFLSQIGLEEIQARIDRFEGEKEDLRQQERKKLLKKEKIKFIQEEVMRFLNQYKIKREGKTLFLDYNELLINNPLIVEYLLDKPKSLIQAIDEHFDGKYDIKFSNLPESININIEGLRKENLNKLISIEGRLTSFGEVRPVITQITFECPSCGCNITIPQNYRIPKIKEPSRCSCGRKGYFRLIERSEQNCSFIQLEDLQERTDNPHSQRIKAVIFNGLCDGEKIKIFAPGNEVKCYGILKEVPVYKKGKQTLFLNWILEVIDAELIEKDIDISKFSEEEVKEIKELSAKINIDGLRPILESFAPDIYGYDSIKSALVLQLCNKRNDTKNKIIRNKSNILLIGDPGVVILQLELYKVAGGLLVVEVQQLG